MLAFFRSRQPGQHWLTALGVVTDAAAISLAAIGELPNGSALRLYRRATGLLRVMRALPAAARSAVGPADGRAGGEPAFRSIYQHLEGRGVALRPYDRAWANLQRLRGEYLPYSGPASSCCWSRPSSATTPPSCRWLARKGSAESLAGTARRALGSLIRTAAP